MRKLVSFVAPAVCLAIALTAACGKSGNSPTTPTTTPTASLGWTFSAEPGTRILGGVDPEPLVVGGTVFLNVGSPSGGQALWSAGDGLNFSQLAAAFPLGASPSFVTLGDGRIRAFYAAPSGLQSSTSRDGAIWTAESGLLLDLAGGNFSVPMVAMMANGSCRVYYAIKSTAQTGTATASDCLTFTVESAGVLSGVDPFVVSDGAGGYLMAFTKPNDTTANATSYIWLAKSSDGFSWTTDAAPLITRASGSVIDPALVPLGANRFRIYYGTSDSGFVNVSNPSVLSGIVSR